MQLRLRPAAAVEQRFGPAAAEQPPARYTDIEVCIDCAGNKPLAKLPQTTDAKVWTGAEWISVKHGTKRCRGYGGCEKYYKLNFISETGRKRNTLQTLETGNILLMNEYIGFTTDFLRQYWNRVCRTGESAQGEAATILMTWPDVPLGSGMKRKAAHIRHGTEARFGFSEDRLKRLLTNAMFSFLRIKTSHFVFDLDDPVPAEDPVYGGVYSGAGNDFYVIFDATKDDLNFRMKKLYNVVTDGNQSSSRRLTADEKQYATTRLAGKPRRKKQSGKVLKQKGKQIRKKVDMKVIKYVVKKPATKTTATNVCKYVSKLHTAKTYRTHIGGLYATVDMEQDPSKGNLVLHAVEMLNGENKAVKDFAIEDMTRSGMKVGEFGHDCSCQFKREWERMGKVRVCKLDGFHWKTHKCTVPKVTNPRFNSQAAEQLWSRLDSLHFMTEYTRARYRFFLKQYLKWRNDFLRSSLSVDVNPAVSHKQIVRHK